MFSFSRLPFRPALFNWPKRVPARSAGEFEQLIYVFEFSQAPFKEQTGGGFWISVLGVM